MRDVYGYLVVKLLIKNPNLGPPYFKQNLTDIKMKAGEILKITLPQLVDDDNDNIKFISVNLG